MDRRAHHKPYIGSVIKMKSKFLILVCFLILLSGIGMVNAETLTGDLGTGEGWLSENYQISYSARIAAVNHLNYITWNDQENGQGFKSLIHWPSAPQWLGTDVGAPNGASTTFTAYKWNTTSGTPSTEVIGTGSIGYQRAYLYNGQESGSYVWILFDESILTSYTGDVSWYIDYNRNSLYNATLSYYPTSGNTPQSGKCGWGPGASSTSYDGQYTMNKDLQFHNSYSVTKPAGLGIQGTVIKEYLGTMYQSRVFIINATDGATISSEGSVNPIQYNFTNNKEIIRICVLSSNATWFNTTDLFTAGSGTTTPTPTVTPYPTTTPSIDGPIPDGYIRSKFQCVDSETDGTIHECQISIKNTNNNSWSNGTHLGTWFIDTLPGAVLDGYGTASGYSDASRTGLPASGSIMYELIMHPGYIPPATTGKVHLYVIVNDYDTGLPINGATVQISGSGEYSQSSTTGRAGSVQFEFANSSTVYVSASKAGYVPGSKAGSTTAAGPDTIRIELRKEVVTTVPTSTIPPGGVTPVVTLDARTSREKDMAMMDKIRNFGPALIDICLLMTVIYLVGGKK